MGTMKVTVEQVIVKDVVEKEIGLPVYLRFDDSEHLYIDEEHNYTYIFYVEGDQGVDDDEVEIVKGEFWLMDEHHKNNINKYLKNYENYVCTEYEFNKFKNFVKEMI